MPTVLDLKPGRCYRVVITGFVLIHYVRGADESERRCARRQLQHGEIITCLQNGASPQRSLKFRTEDGIEGTWFPTDSEGRVPSMALETLAPANPPAERPSPPITETRAVDALDTHFSHQALSDPADTDSGVPSRPSKLPPLERLKRAWKKATSGERIAFMEWILREEAAAEENAKAEED